MTQPEDLDNDDRVTYLVGRVARESSRLEYSTAALLAAVINRPPAGLVLAFGQSFSTNADMLLAIVAETGRLIDAPLVLNQRVTDAIRASKSLWSERNLIVHGMMPGLSAEGRAVLTKRYNRSISREFTTDELQVFVDRLADVAQRITDINNALVEGMI